MENLNLNEKDLQDLLKLCSFEELLELSKFLPPRQQKIFNKYYNEGKSLRTVANEQNGVTYQAISKLKRKSLISLRKLLESKDFILVSKKDSKFANRQSNLTIRKKILKLLEDVDYEKDILPYLNEEEKQFFDNFIFDFNEEENKKILEQGNGIYALHNACKHNYRKVASIKHVFDKVSQMTEGIVQIDPSPEFEGFKNQIIKGILNKDDKAKKVFQNYKKRKQRVDSIVESLGNLDELNSELSDIEVVVLIKYVLAYFKSDKEKLASMLGIKISRLESIITKLRALIRSKTELNEKQKSNQQND